MEHWQQCAYREDPYSEIPFYDGRKWSPDSLVGVTCLVCAIVVALARGFA